MKVGRLSVVVILANVLAVAPARAEDEMSNFKATVEGAGWLFPTLALHVVIHENSHALAARLMGADHVQITYMPRRPRGAWGVTGWSGGMTAGERAFAGFAPIITNVATVATYALLFEAGVPSNEHVRLPVLEIAAWAWADFATALVPAANNHVEGVYKYYRLSSVQRIPFRLVHLGLVVLGYEYLRRGRDSIFDPEEGATDSRVVIPFSMRF